MIWVALITVVETVEADCGDKDIKIAGLAAWIGIACG
jgi:hypothetical protein